MRLILAFLVLTLVGLCAFAYSSTLPLYHNQARFEAADRQIMDRSANATDTKALTEEYYALRAKEKTARGLLADTGLTSIILGIGGMALFCRGAGELKTPPNKWILLLVGLLASAATIFGLVKFMELDDSPPWSDASIRVMADLIPKSLWFLPSFVVAHGIFMVGRKFNLQTQLFGVHLKFVNWMLLAALGLWAIMTAFFMLGTMWYFLIATPLWFYFYASLLAVRAKGHELTAAIKT